MPSEGMRRRKVVYILLALLMAAAVWLYVDNFGNSGGPRLTEQEITGIPITYIGEAGLADRGLMLLSEDSSATVDLTLTGSRFQLMHLDPEDVRVVVDLSRVESAGVQSISYQPSFLDRRFSASMIKERSITSATVHISELNNRTVDVICDLVGNVAEGYSAGQPQLSQDTLEIRGQAADIDPVSYVKVTLDIGENAVESISQALAFQYYDENNQLLDGTNIHPTVQTIQASLSVYVTKELELTVDFQEYPGLRVRNLDYEIRPSIIAVSGEAGLLRGINSITLGKLDLMDLYSSDVKRHTFSIIVPEGCENLSGVTRATLEIEFADLESARVTTEHFRYVNAPGGKQVSILTGSLNVNIFGTAADVAAVTGDDITVTADLSSYSGASGTYNVPAVVEVNTSGDVGVAGTYQVQVTIQEEAPGQPENGEGPEE